MCKGGVVKLRWAPGDLGAFLSRTSTPRDPLQFPCQTPPCNRIAITKCFVISTHRTRNAGAGWSSEQSLCAPDVCLDASPSDLRHSILNPANHLITFTMHKPARCTGHMIMVSMRGAIVGQQKPAERAQAVLGIPYRRKACLLIAALSTPNAPTLRAYHRALGIGNAVNGVQTFRSHKSPLFMKR